MNHALNYQQKVVQCDEIWIWLYVRFPSYNCWERKSLRVERCVFHLLRNSRKIPESKKCMFYSLLDGSWKISVHMKCVSSFPQSFREYVGLKISPYVNGFVFLLFLKFNWKIIFFVNMDTKLVLLSNFLVDNGALILIRWVCW